MTTETQPDTAARVIVLESELRAERQRLAQREEMLAVLNRRLVVLEQQASTINAVIDMPPDPEALRERVRALEEELERMRQTKVFKWSAPLRRLYGLTVRR